MRRVPLVFWLLWLAGCASQGPAPVGEGRPALQVESGARPAATAGATAVKTHVVKKGDTLKGIAVEHGVDVRDLAVWNNIDNPNRIRVGQTLRVGAAAEPAAATVTTAAPEVRPLGDGAGVVARSLDTPSTEGSPRATPAHSADNSETLKRSPKGGKLPYSEANLARMKGQESGPVAVSDPASPAGESQVEKPVAADAGGIDWSWPSAGKLIGSYTDGGSGESNKGLDFAGKLGDPVQVAAAGKVIYVGAFPKYGNLVVVLHGGGFSTVYAHNQRILVKEGQQVAGGQKIAELGNSDADQPKLHFELRLQGKPVDPLKHLPAR